MGGNWSIPEEIHMDVGEVCQDVKMFQGIVPLFQQQQQTGVIN